MGAPNLPKLLKTVLLYLSNQHECLKKNDLITESMDDSYKEMCAEMEAFGIPSYHKIVMKSPNKPKPIPVPKKGCVVKLRRLNDSDIKQFVKPVNKSPSYITKNKHIPTANVRKSSRCSRLPAKFLDDTIITQNLANDSSDDDPTWEDYFVAENIRKSEQRNHRKRQISDDTMTTNVSSNNNNVPNGNCDGKLSQMKQVTHNESNHQITTEALLRCLKCPKKFLEISALKTHMEIEHIEKKINKCQICKRVFDYESSLTEHKLFHTKLNMYGCQICRQQFKEAQKLAVHIRNKHDISMLFKSHSCEICDFKFIKARDLRAHIRTEHSTVENFQEIIDEPYSCDICHERYGLLRNLVEHFELH